MKTGRLRFQIEVENEDGTIVKHQQEIDVDTEQLDHIDSVEQIVIGQGNESMRQFLSKHLSSVSKKKVNLAGLSLRLCKGKFRVVGEIGRYDFEVYESESGQRHFVKQSGKTCYQTSGYKKCVLYQGACNTSYRITQKMYNNTNKQKDHKHSHRTIESHVVSEAKRIQASMNESIRLGKAKEEGDARVEATFKPMGKKRCENQFNKLLEQADSEIAKHLKDKGWGQIESKKDTVYIEIDDICCKEQKSNRRKDNTEEKEKEMLKKQKARKQGKKAYKESKYLFHTVGLLSKGDKKFTLISEGLSAMTDKVKGFMKAVDCEACNWVFLVDGQQNLQTKIQNDYSDKPKKIILDWYHLKKKVRSQLMMGMKKSEKRENKYSTICKYLWYGLTQQAIDQINSIEEKETKNKEALKVLIKYIERQEELIPNYALRKQMELKNSTSGVEKRNDILVAHRQKKNGMSWSKTGSHALAVLEMLKINGQVDSFHESGQVLLKWAA